MSMDWMDRTCRHLGCNVEVGGHEFWCDEHRPVEKSGVLCCICRRELDQRPDGSVVWHDHSCE